MYKKRAQHISMEGYIIFYVAVFLFLIYFLGRFINSAYDPLAYQQEFLANDITLIIKTIQAAQGDVLYVYEIQSTDRELHITFKDNKIFVEIEDLLKSSKTYSKNIFLEYNFEDLENPKKILFEKKGNKISIKKLE